MWELQKQRADALLSAIKAGDNATIVSAADDYLRLGGSSDRPWMFLEIMKAYRVNGEAFWRILHLCWNGFDRIPHRQFARLFRIYRQAWRSEYLPLADAEEFCRLPETITVYRGQDATAPVGLSWSTKRSVAEDFARGHRMIFNPSPVVIEAQVSKAEIAGIYTDRDEVEITVFSTKAAKKRNVVPLVKRAS
jgi:hypothetical protein